MNQTSEGYERKPNPVFDYFAPLVGEWDRVGSHPLIPAELHGYCSFEWLEGDALLIWRSVFERPGPPHGISALGGDDSLGTYQMLYCDERGVSRIYQLLKCVAPAGQPLLSYLSKRYVVFRNSFQAFWARHLRTPGRYLGRSPVWVVVFPDPPSAGRVQHFLAISAGDDHSGLRFY